MVLTRRTFFKEFVGGFYFYPSQIPHWQINWNSQEIVHYTNSSFTLYGSFNISLSFLFKYKMLFSSYSKIHVIWQLTNQKTVTDILGFHSVQIIWMLRLPHQVLQEGATWLSLPRKWQPRVYRYRSEGKPPASMLHMGLQGSARSPPLSFAPLAPISPSERNIWNMKFLI